MFWKQIPLKYYLLINMFILKRRIKQLNKTYFHVFVSLMGTAKSNQLCNIKNNIFHFFFILILDFLLYNNDLFIIQLYHAM